MTDLSARLRDVLSDDVIAPIAFNLYTCDQIEQTRDYLIEKLAPLLSSLLEEQQREIREALEQMLSISGDPNAVTGEFDTTAGRARRLLSRLSSSSSPAAQEK